ncbi:MAG: IPT/TIG domain-containing protein [Spirochaetaceae bacterium]|jgi:transglutaminase-like putative cysteine protease|nr:IPT/TIG domain-containing protein [Spirochaetaceae bacterium]
MKKKAQTTNHRFRFLLSFISLSCLLAFSACSNSQPHISSISPRLGTPGEALLIEGSGFGRERGESYITIGGASPVSQAYLEWSDRKISLIIPEFGDSGLVYVYVGNKVSNAALLGNKSQIPSSDETAHTEEKPLISSLLPQSARIGMPLRIQGSNFSLNREGCRVWFTYAGTGDLSLVDTSEHDLNYISWGDREVQVIVPDGAATGNIYIETRQGMSAPFYFEVTAGPGSKVFPEKRNYTIKYSVDIRVGNASGDNTLYMWMPLPVISASQRRSELLERNTEPYIADYKGVSLYKLDNLQAGEPLRIEQSYIVDVYSVQTRVTAAQVRAEPQPSALESNLLMPSLLVPSDDEAIKKQALQIIARETNPYNKARRVFNWVIGNIDIKDARDDSVGDAGDNAVSALEKKLASPYSANLLLCALLRAAAVPAEPVAGVLVNDFPNTVSHYWSEFWLSGLGWIPVDVALAKGLAPRGFELPDDYGEFYFGNLDNLRIAFSRGETLLSQMNPRGRPVRRNQQYALQSLWEEAVGNIDAYSSLWSGILVDGMYAQ